ncbi:TnsA-like heteromeric transposase endonuclease subunit [Kitasatospora sp. NPDC059795]|uniref:TnsA-like heteromeric transposase endonuclease subunit n=1 Tax=Kitasatospora sp. NPDC059795 TaxID=3346949 RepID=UPI00365807F8
MVAVLVEAEFLDRTGRRVKAPVGALAGEPLEERGPVWQPAAHRGSRATTTLWWAATTRKPVGFAGLERQRVAVELDFDRCVVAFSGAPVRLSWTCGGRDETVVADFVARQASGSRLLVLCPPARTARREERWGETQEVLREVCSAAGWRLHLPGPSSAVRTGNLYRAAQFRHPRHWDAAGAQALLAAFARPRPLREGALDAGLPALSALARAYHLLWRQRLSFDWETPLVPTSVVSAAGGAR